MADWLNISSGSDSEDESNNEVFEFEHGSYLTEFLAVFRMGMILMKNSKKVMHLMILESASKLEKLPQLTLGITGPISYHLDLVSTCAV